MGGQAGMPCSRMCDLALSEYVGNSLISFGASTQGSALLGDRAAITGIKKGVCFSRVLMANISIVAK